MAYSNVTPPAALPDTYDASAHPNYVMVFDYEQGATDWYQAHMYYSATAFTFDGTHITNTEGVIRKNIYANDGAVWLGEETIDGYPELSPGLHNGVYQRIYTNHDILDGDGNVYLAADSFIEVKLFDLKSWLIGFALGLAGKPLPLAVRKPVAYLYNGVRLPVLPEWDKSKYPYAAIGKTLVGGIGTPVPTGTRYVLTVFSGTRYATTDKFFFTIPALEWAYYGGQWVFLKELTEANSIASSDGTYFATLTYGVAWADHDVFDSNGSLYLAASDPVPVYE